MAKKKRLSRRVVSRYSLQNQKRKKMRILEALDIPVVPVTPSINWDIEWVATAIPTTPWEIDGNFATNEIVGDYLHLKNIEDGACYGYYDLTRNDPSTGYSLEFEMKLISNDGGEDATYVTMPNVKGWLHIFSDRIKIIYPVYTDEGKQWFEYLLDTTDNFHKYKIITNSENITKIYVDDVVVGTLDGTLDAETSAESNYIEFGCWSSIMTQESYWKSLKYADEGSF